MRPVQAYYIQLIQQDILERQQDNPNYSLRAYARDALMNASTLSQILKGKRSLPLKDAERLVQRLNLDGIERTRFMESVMRTKTSLDEIKINEVDARPILDDTYYQVIAEWEHYALLELFELTNFSLKTDTVASKLQISNDRAQEVLDNLVQAKLIKVNPNGSYGRLLGDFKTTEDVSMKALRDSHTETLEMAMDKLDVDIALRDYSSATYAIDLEKISEVKTIIREFRMKMGALLKPGNKTDIYQLSIQFFPLTNPANSPTEDTK